jgi:hypothetical protein
VGGLHRVAIRIAQHAEIADDRARISGLELQDAIGPRDRGALIHVLPARARESEMCERLGRRVLDRMLDQNDHEAGASWRFSDPHDAPAVRLDAIVDDFEVTILAIEVDRTSHVRRPKSDVGEVWANRTGDASHR